MSLQEYIKQLPENLSTIGMDDLPKVFISTPWNFPYISAAFATSLRNMFVPIPHIYDPMQGRYVADARNAIIYNALESQFDLVMMIDGDNYPSTNFFIDLWKLIKPCPDNTIATGWSVIKSGRMEGRSSIFKWRNGDFDALTIEETSLQTSPFEAEGFGSCGFLCSTEIFRKLQHPWFADINIIHEERKLDEFYMATEFAMGQDLCFSIKARQAGIKIICDPRLRMPHEVISTI